MNPAFEFTGEAVPVLDDDLAKDFFPTPLPVVRSSVRAIQLARPPAVVLDPSAGNTGRWGLFAKERWAPRWLDGAELRDVCPVQGYDAWHIGDFLEYVPPVKPDLILTNPPFSIWEYFVDHSLDILADTGTLILFLRVQALGGRKRYLHFYPAGHLRHVYYLASRVAFIRKADPNTGKLRSVADVWDYGLLEFDKQYHQEWTGSWYDYKTTPMKPRPAQPLTLPDLNRSNLGIALPEARTLRLF